MYLQKQWTKLIIPNHFLKKRLTFDGWNQIHANVAQREFPLEAPQLFPLSAQSVSGTAPHNFSSFAFVHSGVFYLTQPSKEDPAHIWEGTMFLTRWKLEISDISSKSCFQLYGEPASWGNMEIPTHLEFPKEAGKTICVVGITIYKHCQGFPSLMATHSRNIALKSLSLSKHIQWLFCVHWKNNTFSDLSNGSIWRTMPPCMVSLYCILILDSRCSRRMLTTYD